jgi:nucleotide-binding universal stress UspA family protein
MFRIEGRILAAMDLDKGSDELLRQADALARSYHVKLSVCHVLPEIFAVRPLFPQLHLDDALRLYDLEAAVRDALLKRIRTMTGREPPQVEIEIEQGTVHAGILRAADNIGAGVVVVGGGGRSHGGARPGQRCGACSPLRALCRSCGAALAWGKGTGSDRLFRPRTSCR